MRVYTAECDQVVRTVSARNFLTNDTFALFSYTEPRGTLWSLYPATENT